MKDCRAGGVSITRGPEPSCCRVVEPRLLIWQVLFTAVSLATYFAPGPN